MTVTTIASHALRARILDAHGGLDRWRTFSRITAKVVSGGFLWAMKGIDIDAAPRIMTSDFRRQWTRDVAGKLRAAHLISDYVDIRGLRLPTSRRDFMRNHDGALQRDKMPVSVDPLAEGHQGAR